MGGVKAVVAAKICAWSVATSGRLALYGRVMELLLVMGLIPAVLWPNDAKTLVLEWLQFAAYLVGGGLVAWKFVSFIWRGREQMVLWFCLQNPLQNSLLGE